MLKVFAQSAATTAEAAAPAGIVGLISSFLPFIIIIAVFYFLLIRPQRKQEKKNREMLAAIKVGDNITTIGGMVGKITKIKDEKVIFETGPKQELHQITIERWAIKSVQKEVSDEE